MVNLNKLLYAGKKVSAFARGSLAAWSTFQEAPNLLLNKHRGDSGILAPEERDCWGFRIIADDYFVVYIFPLSSLNDYVGATYHDFRVTVVGEGESLHIYGHYDYDSCTYDDMLHKLYDDLEEGDWL